MPKITLKFLKSKIDYTHEFPVLKFDGELRSPIIIKKYEEEKEIIKNKRLSVKDYILVKKFGFNSCYYQILIDGKFEQKMKAGEPENKIISKFKLLKNDYPYHGFNHNILWINSNDLETIRNALEITKLDYAGIDYIYFQNEPKNQSVDSITHFHFLSKKLCQN